ncbi:MAG: S8 family peptidase [Candidatus Coatesbacteria bacterium]|nr:MAG: S8 family peptidase [Candidatus Coatesbacteria bacterium]
MRKLIVTALLIGVAVSVSTGATLEQELWAKMASADADEYIPIYLVMADRVSPTELEYVLEGAPSEVRRDYVVTTLKAKAEETQIDILEYLDTALTDGSATDVRSIWLNNVISMNAKPGLIEELSLRDDVERLAYDAERMVLCESRDVTPGRALAWGVEKVGADEAWDAGYTGNGAIVAVLDTGCDYLHTDLVNVMWHNDDDFNNGVDDDGNGYVDDYYGWNFNNNTKEVRGGSNGHGSHCAGTVAGDGSAGTETGVAPGANIMAVQVLSNSGYGDEPDVWDGMGYALDNGAHVISMSLGWSHAWDPDRPTWRETCDTIIAGGMTLVIAAGNERGYYSPPDAVRTPGDVPHVITVGATDSSDNYSYFSSPGPVTWQDVTGYEDFPYPPGLIKPDVAAPGSSIVSVRGITGGYSTKSGTSMATPHTAGLAALMLDAVPGMTNHEIRWCMGTSALDLGDTGKDNDYGHGRIQCLPAINKALEGGPIPGDGPEGSRATTDDSLAAKSVAVKSFTPNPVTGGYATVNLEVGEGCTDPVSVRIYDIAGRKVSEVRENNPVAGMNSIEINTGNLSSGVYIVSITAGESNAAVKMVVTR